MYISYTSYILYILYNIMLYETVLYEIVTSYVNNNFHVYVITIPNGDHNLFTVTS